MPIYSDTDLKVETLLQQWGIKRDTQYYGLKSDGNWQGDSFTVSLGTQSFTYKTGIGHRYTNLAIGAKPPKWAKKRDKSVGDMHAIIGRVGFPIKDLYATFAPVPASAGVIWSLLLDSSASNESFDDWCADLGYDTDSRKALDLYLACQQNGIKLRKVFTCSQLETIQAMLEDY